MFKKEVLFFITLVLVGFLDWLTTITGILFFGAREVNPLLSGLTSSNMLLFSFLKLAAVIIVGFAFYKATVISESTSSSLHSSRRILYGGFSLTFISITAVVASNMATILRI